ncbi:MAG: hypothetical protein PHU42_00625 [Patescibacteria group bacterium]|nr:hypothetical protein [Patescibacteria group bacterium]
MLKKNGIRGKIGEITIVAYSGGYWAATKSLVNNPTLDIRTVVFLDTLYWHADDVMDWFDATSGKRLIIFCSQEKESVAAESYVMNAASYVEAAFVEVSEEYFFEKADPDFPFVFVKTAKSHEDIPDLLGPVLKKLRGK